MFVYDGPITGRSGNVLAAWYGYGFDSPLEQLASAIPPSGLVADIGSGRSNLGAEVCKLRDDISWHNIDPAYAETDLRDQLSHNAPTNLDHIPLSILELPNREHSPNTYDNVFSYWFLPHILRQDEQQGIAAISNMILLLNSAGVLKIGPVINQNNHTVANTIAVRLPEASKDIHEVATTAANGIMKLKKAFRSYNYLKIYVT